MICAPTPAPDPGPILMPESNSPGVDFNSLPLLNSLIRRRFIGICLVTFWWPKRHLFGDKQMSIRLL